MKGALNVVNVCRGSLSALLNDQKTDVETVNTRICEYVRPEACISLTTHEGGVLVDFATMYLRDEEPHRLKSITFGARGLSDNIGPGVSEDRLNLSLGCKSLLYHQPNHLGRRAPQ